MLLYMVLWNLDFGENGLLNTPHVCAAITTYTEKQHTLLTTPTVSG